MPAFNSARQARSASGVILYPWAARRRSRLKGFDWDVMNRLHEKGYITDPVGKAKSVVFTAEEMDRSRRLLEQLFCKAE